MVVKRKTAYKNAVNCLFPALALLVVWTFLFPVAKADVLDPDKWYAEYLKSSKDQNVEAGGALIKTVVMIDKFPKKKPPAMKKFNLTAFNRMGFLQTLDVNSVPFYFKINTPPKSIQRKSSYLHDNRDEWLYEVSIATEADMVIDMSESTWEGYASGPNAVKKIFQYDGSSINNKISDYPRAIASALGYDGVLLDQKNNSYLLALFSRPKKLGVQALLLKGSEKVYTLPKSAKGDGLFELVKIGQGVGVFTLIVPGATGPNVPRGSKFSMENSGK